jgi:hypothetical protein
LDDLTCPTVATTTTPTPRIKRPDLSSCSITFVGLDRVRRARSSSSFSIEFVQHNLPLLKI